MYSLITVAKYLPVADWIDIINFNNIGIGFVDLFISFSLIILLCCVLLEACGLSLVVVYRLLLCHMGLVVTQKVESLLPDQDWNPHPLSWKAGS